MAAISSQMRTLASERSVAQRVRMAFTLDLAPAGSGPRVARPRAARPGAAGPGAAGPRAARPRAAGPGAARPRAPRPRRPRPGAAVPVAAGPADSGGLEPGKRGRVDRHAEDVLLAGERHAVAGDVILPACELDRAVADGRRELLHVRHRRRDAEHHAELYLAAALC